ASHRVTSALMCLNNNRSILRLTLHPMRALSSNMNRVILPEVPVKLEPCGRQWFGAGGQKRTHANRFDFSIFTQ
ncbi:hypothetical protein C8R44DRAFT_804766, partial [Mycena epipterygia]